MSATYAICSACGAHIPEGPGQLIRRHFVEEHGAPLERLEDIVVYGFPSDYDDPDAPMRFTWGAVAGAEGVEWVPGLDAQ